jgi:hypothetical protein
MIADHFLPISGRHKNNPAMARRRITRLKSIVAPIRDTK